MTRKLPDKIIDIDQIRINRNIEKICSCENRKFVLDTQNRRVICNSCGSIVDPYDAMYDLSQRAENMRSQVERLLEQRKQILDYKPYLLTIRSLEKRYRGKKSLPCCPRCDEPFYLEELKVWSGKSYADARIQKFKEEKKNK